ncbi:hypothetical protein H1C71_036163 [Ictidomys tridecemlineatus]|nr:hypothetical protein H1C71_036163 [Ictidomys tridecemlineatus]
MEAGSRWPRTPADLHAWWQVVYEESCMGSLMASYVTGLSGLPRVALSGGFGTVAIGEGARTHAPDRYFLPGAGSGPSAFAWGREGPLKATTTHSQKRRGFSESWTPVAVPLFSAPQAQPEE